MYHSKSKVLKYRSFDEYKDAIYPVSSQKELLAGQEDVTSLGQTIVAITLEQNSKLLRARHSRVSRHRNS